jgi:hypothetical protein
VVIGDQDANARCRVGHKWSEPTDFQQQLGQTQDSP